MYAGAEHMAKFAVYKANVEFISAHNKLYVAGEETFSLSEEELVQCDKSESSSPMAFAFLSNSFHILLKAA